MIYKYHVCLCLLKATATFVFIYHSLCDGGGAQPFNYFTQGVSASEIELDTLTGDVRILRADITMDVGNSINPAIDIGQIEGAFVQGYGWCTMEEVNGAATYIISDRLAVINRLFQQAS